MNKLLLITILLVLSSAVFSQDPSWQWAIRAGGISWDSGAATAIDSQGNLYIGGNFQGTAIYGSTTITSSGGNDIFIAKLDSSGNWLWVRKAGGPSIDVIYGLAVDAYDNVYVTGIFGETATFATTTITSAGNTDVFVAKLDTNGFLEWVSQAGGTDPDGGHSLALDNSGNIYVAGYYAGTAGFGVNSITGFGYDDAFVAKLDNEGNWQWARGAGGTGYDRAFGIAADSSGNSYVTGCFSSTATFTPFTLTSNGSMDIFIAKVNTNGFLLGAFSWGGEIADVGSAVAVDPDGNVYLTGHIGGTVAFGPFILNGEGAMDIFAMKMNSSAIIQWAARAGGDGWDEATAIAVDSMGNTYLTGHFQGTAAFANVNLTSLGYYDAFIAKLDTNGFLGWAVQAGGTNNEMGNGIAVDSSGNVYVIGYFTESTAFGPTVLTSLGDAETFIAKIYSSPVGIDDDFIPSISTQSLLYNAYPNPVTKGREVNISLKTSEIKNAILSVYNLKGQLIESRKLTQGSHNIIISTGLYNAGVYLLCLKSDTEVAVKKLVIIK